MLIFDLSLHILAESLDSSISVYPAWGETLRAICTPTVTDSDTPALLLFYQTTGVKTTWVTHLILILFTQRHFTVGALSQRREYSEAQG